MSHLYGRTPPWLYPDAPRRRMVDCACGVASAETDDDGCFPNRCAECNDPRCDACQQEHDLCATCDAKDREKRENAKTLFLTLTAMSRAVAEGGAS